MKRENKVLIVATVTALFWVVTFILWLSFCGAP